MPTTVTDRISTAATATQTDRLSAYLQLESGGYLLLETGGKVKLENTTGGVAGTQTDRLPAFPT